MDPGYEETGRQGWDGVAAALASSYDTGANPYYALLNAKQIKGLIGDVAGLTVLDLGCGPGHLTRDMARAGARVIGVDFADAMIKQAQLREDHERSGACFRVALANDLAFLDDSSFDLVVSAMALHDIAAYEATVDEVVRILKPKARFVFSVCHPCFDTPVQEWLHDPATGKPRGKRVDRYFDRGQKEYPIPEHFPSLTGLDHSLKCVFFFRTLADYFRPLLIRGMILVALEEPQPTESDLAVAPSLARVSGIPHSLHVSWRKP
jgi:SAM-dependent methyltransferase